MESYFKYEDLLSNESDMGRQISEAIERILGVPVLTTARSTALMLKESSEKREAKAAQSDQRTQEYGNALADIQVQREALKKDLAGSHEVLERLKERKAELEEALRRRERYALLMEKRDGLSKQVVEIDDRRRAKVDSLRSSMSTAWTLLVAEKVERARTDLTERKRDLDVSISQLKALDDMAKGNSESCPTCLRSIGEGDKERIESALAAGDGSSIEQHEIAIEALTSKLSALARISSTSRSDAPKLCWDAVDELNVDLATKKEELSEIKKALENVDELTLRKEKHEYETTIRHIEVTERSIGDCQAKLLEKETSSEKIQKKLDQLAGGTLDRERKLRTLYSSIHELLDEAVGAYRDKLRERVQADATKHLKLLTTEPEYASLRINENYGLSIVHEDGQEIPVRSAGAEHVVALCLVGALQNNAPLEGPIIIDSPFGRLDAEHTTNIIRALPGMARQVMLLVYEDELPADLARTELKGKLKSEWVMKRVSARHTDLARRIS
ncbi:MAG: hypothetical protein O2797_08990 [Bacteroidetes bacterium]|nr:hypothetical protein [Bacteroidota bacterium]